MILPKHALLYDAPDRLWGVGRLRNPVVLMHLRTLPGASAVRHAEVILWPPDWEALTTPKKTAKIIDALWGYLDLTDADDHDSYGQEQVDLGQALPRWLLVDDEDADFTGLLDTERAVLWSVDDTGSSLTACLEWQLHPKLKPQIKFPASTREVAEVWRAWIKAERDLQDESR